MAVAHLGQLGFLKDAALHPLVVPEIINRGALGGVGHKDEVEELLRELREVRRAAEVRHPELIVAVRPDRVVPPVARRRLEGGGRGERERERGGGGLSAPRGGLGRGCGVGQRCTCWNGGHPASMMKRTTPADQRSALAPSYPCLAMTSGAMYDLVPTHVWHRVSISKLTAARPKSASFSWKSAVQGSVGVGGGGIER